MMIKLVPTDSWDFGEPTTARIKVASRGLRGDDLHEFVKRAGSELAERVRRLEHLPGEDWVHNIALGCGEKYGLNRNGDRFGVEACRNHHHTFVKHGHCYRNHYNKDPRRSYGEIKDSWFNEPMGRVELILALNGTKEAADRNHALVADKEIALLDHGEEVPTSMACKIAHDFCTSCGNKARSRAEYCDEHTCPHGGLKRNIGKVAADGHQLGADNLEPCWFDNSHVERGACRVAFILGRIKTASADDVIKCGAALAEEAGVSAPYDILAAGAPTACYETLKLAYELADVERAIEAGQVPSGLSTLHPAVYRPIDGLDKYATSLTGQRTAITSLAQRQILLSLSEFATLVKSAVAGQASALLPGIYQRLTADDEGLRQLLEANPYTPVRGVSHDDSAWAYKQAYDRGLDLWRVDQRDLRATLRQLPAPALTRTYVKTAADNPRAEELAVAYALYKLAFAEYQQSCIAAPQCKELMVAQDYLAFS